MVKEVIRTNNFLRRCVVLTQTKSFDFVINVALDEEVSVEFTTLLPV